jgi:hypothetical protein
MSDVLKRLREGVSAGSLTLTGKECEEFWQILRQFERDKNHLLLAANAYEDVLRLAYSTSPYEYHSKGVLSAMEEVLKEKQNV